MGSTVTGNRRVPRPNSGRRRALAWLSAVALIGLSIGGCSGIRSEKAPPQPPVPKVIESAEFTIADNLNDVWNTVGQILVRLDHIDYESRAQMMGIYSIRYRGERLLIRTQAVVLTNPTDGVLTRVMALGPEGKPIHSRVANELLGILEQRIPLEIEKYRTPIKLKKPAKAKKKKKK